jgi:outer membrane immunogenic protein
MISRIALFAVLIGFAHQVTAQTAPAKSLPAAPLEVTLAYSADRTNGVVGGCGCFWMGGGKAEASTYWGRGLSVVAELAGEHKNNINSAGEGLSLVSYLFGPRYTLVTRSRFAPFAQLLAGGVHGFDGVFPGSGLYISNPDAFAFAVGGGFNFRLSRRFALRAVQADYFQTRLPNATDNQQNHFRISGGVVFRIGENQR